MFKAGPKMTDQRGIEIFFLMVFLGSPRTEPRIYVLVGMGSHYRPGNLFSTIRLIDGCSRGFDVLFFIFSMAMVLS